jgi:hypothetical protein
MGFFIEIIFSTHLKYILAEINKYEIFKDAGFYCHNSSFC